MKHLGLKTLLMALLLTFVFVACEETTTPNDPKPKPNAPKNLVASSIDSSSIKLKWTASDSTASTLFSGYVIEITPGSWQPVSITGNQTTAVITGLDEGTVYTFNIFAKYSNGEESASSASVSWSPATRFIKNINDDFIKVYEYASLLGSGLDLYDPANGKPRTLTVATSGDWNLGLDTRTDGEIWFGSPTEIGYSWTGGTPPDVFVSNQFYPADAIEDVYDSEALDAIKHSYSLQLAELVSVDLQGKSGLVMVVRLKEGNSSNFTYAKVFIKKSALGWLQGFIPNRYIEAEVSYQRVPGVPYAF